MPAQPVDDVEAILVREVVPEEHRGAAAERRLSHELLDGNALVAARRLELRHHLAALHFHPFAKMLRGLVEDRMDGACEVRSQAVVKREARALVLEYQAF